MDGQEATRTCGQCHREVAEANFALHESHCRRFLCVCPDCDEAVPKEQLSQHREEQHSQVRCSKCRKKMERWRLSDHESDECVERLQRCGFCELDVPWKDLDGHLVVCGSRTELCEDCGRYVQMRELPEHGLTCSGSDQGQDSVQGSDRGSGQGSVQGSGPLRAVSGPPHKAQTTASCSRCGASFPAGGRAEHECFVDPRWDGEDDEDSEEEEDFSRLGAAAQLSAAYKNTSLTHTRPGTEVDGDPEEISSCPHCHLTLPLLTLRWHVEKCRKHLLLKNRES
ncbi:XIAP-associated factor 1 [Menidia menidia]